MFLNHKARHIEPDRREKERKGDGRLDELKDKGSLASVVSDDRARKLPNFYLGTQKETYKALSHLLGYQVLNRMD